MTTFSSDSDSLLFGLEDRVATFTLNRPEARNALADEMTLPLRRGISWANDSEDVGAIVITGAGSAFCAGGDVKNMAGGGKPPSLQSQYDTMIARHLELAGALHQSRKPTIAALPGAAAGAGMAIALACDFRIAAESAFLSTAYARIGLSGDYGIAWLLTRTVGPAKAKELMLTSARVNANDALTMNLVTKVCDPESLMEATQSFAKQLASGPSVAFGYMKDNLDEALFIDHKSAIEREADRLIKARSTEDHREAVQAFKDKREPVFKQR